MWDVVRDEGDGSFWRAAHYLKRRILERSPEEIAEGAVRFRDMASRVETEHVRQRLLRMANEFEGRLETLAFECGSHWIPEPWMLVASEGARTVRCDPDPFRDDDGHETIRLPAGEKIRTDLRMDDPSGARWVRVQLHGRRCWVPEAHVRLAPADPPGSRDGGVDDDRLRAVEFDLPAGLAGDPSLIALLRIPGVDRFEAATERFGVRIAAALADRWRDDAAGEWRPPFDGFFEAPWFDRLRHAFDARPD